MYRNPDCNISPGSPYEWYELGVSLRRKEMFGEAINAFRQAEEMAEALAMEVSEARNAEELLALRNRARASIDLIKSIRGFVNKDLMNP